MSRARRASVSVGADEVALAIAQQAKKTGASIQLVRNGSWGACWLEPLVEVEVDGTRIAYGNVDAGDVPGLFEAGLLEGGAHEKRLGPSNEIAYLISQDRWTFWRCGLIEALSLEDFLAHQGFKALQKAWQDGADAVIDAVTASGLRGRGGAGFPAGIKWRTVADAEGDQKYIACNADEGDSGTFSDRMLMEGDPFGLIESMAIAGFAVGANKGYIYLRSEYPLTYTILSRAIDTHAKPAGLATTSRAAVSISTSSCTSGRVRTYVARKLRCSRASKARKASCATSRHCPPSKGCSANRRSSTTS